MLTHADCWMRQVEIWIEEDSKHEKQCVCARNQHCQFAITKEAHMDMRKKDSKSDQEGAKHRQVESWKICQPKKGAVLHTLMRARGLSVNEINTRA